MATKAKPGPAVNPNAGEDNLQEESAGAPATPPRPRKTAAARVATKTARAAKRQAKKSGKAVAGAAAAPAAAPKKPAAASGARTTSAAKRKAAAAAKGNGILSRSIGKVRNAFSSAASSLSSLVRSKRKG